jgi:hypothetical protein
MVRRATNPGCKDRDLADQASSRKWPYKNYDLTDDAETAGYCFALTLALAETLN